jgi:methyl-accepting chemotaxis protein
MKETEHRAKKTVTISARIWLMSGFLCLLILGIGLISREYLQNVSREYSGIVEQNMPKQRMALELLAQFRQIRIDVRTLGLEGITEAQLEKKRTEVVADVMAFEQLTSEFRNKDFLPGEEVIYKQLEDRWEEFKRIGLRAVELSRSRDQHAKAELMKIFHEDCPRVAGAFNGEINRLLTFHKDSAFARSNEAKTMASRSNDLTGSMLGFGLVIGFFISFVIGRNVGSRLNRVTDEVAGSNKRVNKVVEGLSSASEQLASASHQQASSIEEISSSLEEISGMVDSTLRSSKETVQLSEKVSGLVGRGTGSMNDLQSAVSHISESNIRVEQLSKLIEEIGQKTELIDEIVFQTRLLSFNASVEAERAGEHGRGFAVVAQEVGNLAQLSGKSASEIGEIVRKTMKEAMEVTTVNRRSVENGVTLCKQTAEHFQSIETASQEILSSANAIFRASQEQNAGIQQINQNIQLINQSTQENAASAEECANGSKSLMAQSRKLTGVVGQLEMLVHGKVRSTSGFRQDHHHHQDHEEDHGGPELSHDTLVEDHEPTLGSFSPRAKVIPMPKKPASPVQENKKVVGLEESEDDAWDKL